MSDALVELPRGAVIRWLVVLALLAAGIVAFVRFAPRTNPVVDASLPERAP